MPHFSRPRPSPDQLLKRVEAEVQFQERGKLKVFLGYASGVGKSFRMLDEGRRRKMRGEDVVVAAIQPETGQEATQLLSQLACIPMRTDLASPCLDVEAVKRRRPGLCLIDGLAYRNPPGSKNAERWQDVDELLCAGISVLTSVNLQYVRERQPEVELILGKQVEDSVPESFLMRADEIEIVDAPPEYCLNRAQVGSPQESVRLEQQLSHLREIALLLTAEVVDRQLEAYLHRHGIDQTYGTQERVLVCITPRSNASLMIHRGRRQSNRFHGDLYVAYVGQGPLASRDQRMLEESLETAREVGAHVEVLQGEDPVTSILRHAAANGITQIFVGHSASKGWLNLIRPDVVERLILEADGIDVRIFPNQNPDGTPML